MGTSATTLMGPWLPNDRRGTVFATGRALGQVVLPLAPRPGRLLPEGARRVGLPVGPTPRPVSLFSWPKEVAVRPNTARALDVLREGPTLASAQGRT